MLMDYITPVSYTHLDVYKRQNPRYTGRPPYPRFILADGGKHEPREPGHPQPVGTQHADVPGPQTAAAGTRGKGGGRKPHHFASDWC